MENPSTQNSSQTFIELSGQTLAKVALLGVGLGLVSWLLTMLIRQVVFVPLFCGDPANAACVGATGSAGVLALIITGIIGLLGLVRLGVYRPLLVALAAAISLWGMSLWTGNMQWYEALAWSIVLYALTYVLYTWLVRPRAFGFALGAVLVAVVLSRIVIAL
jgi:Ca2+/Na+ antiporter